MCSPVTKWLSNSPRTSAIMSVDLPLPFGPQMMFKPSVNGPTAVLLAKQRQPSRQIEFKITSASPG